MRNPILAVLLAFAAPLAAQAAGSTAGTSQPAAPASGAPVEYTLDLTHPGGHLAHVTIDYRAQRPVTEFQMPAWYPGRYAIYNFAVNVQQVSASCAETSASGTSLPGLPVERADPNTWRVRNGDCHAVRFDYRVFGNNLDGTFFQVDGTHANINGGPVYMYALDDRGHHKADPARLHIAAPPGWKVLNEMGDLGQTDIAFANYDLLIDAPTEVAPGFTLDTFVEGGKTYRVMIHDYATADDNDGNRAQLLAGLKKIVARETAVIGPDDLERYTFFFHFDPAAESDGMEHLYGTQIDVAAGLGSDAGLQDALFDAAHEFFHQWNVKRIRPLALGPWDYERENPTPSLWVAEGFTQYYGEITLERTGLVGERDFLAALGANLGASLSQPAYREIGAETASLEAWFHDEAPLKQRTDGDETWFSYYDRGEQIASVLDLDIRRRTGGRKSLDDAMRWLWENTWRAPARATYYLPGRGYGDDDVRAAVEAAAGASYADFFRNYVAGTEPIPYNDYLSAAGLRLDCRLPAGAHNYTGLEAASAPDGGEVGLVAGGSPGEQAGFGSGDVIASVNGKDAAGRGLEMLAELPAGRPAQISVRRHGGMAALTLIPSAPRATECALRDLPNPSPAQKELRAQWLH